jgi:aminoglycoside phosphotransferase (APT) family kinase protein
LYNESVAVPLARSARVRTPALLVYDDSRDLLPVPFTVYERVHGETLSLLDLEPDDTPEVWRELGRDLARLHSGVDRERPGSRLGTRENLPDPRVQAEELAKEGLVSASEARWLIRWLDRIAPAALTPVERRFSHGDTQATNVMVHSRSLEYVAVLDWGSAGWGDAAWDFAGGALRAVPSLLAGHREVAALDADETAEARILWRHLQLALFNARRRPQPNHSWAERLLTMLLDIMRSFLSRPPDPWDDLAPP